jgi:hypothetical protein
MSFAKLIWSDQQLLTSGPPFTAAVDLGLPPCQTVSGG